MLIAPIEKILFDAFVSHSRQDINALQLLVEQLQSKKLRIAIDQEQLRGGEIWRQKLKGLIEHSQNVIFLISQASLDSKWCRWELDLVVTLNKRLIPVLISTEMPADLPESLGAVQRIDARGKQINSAAGAIIEALQTDQKWAELHTELGLRAQKWDEGGTLLGGREVKKFQTAVEQYRGKRPFPTNQQTLFLLESRRSARKRFWSSVGAVIAVLLGLGFLGFNWWIEQRNARYIGLRRQGESALVSLGENDFAAAVASLGYVACADSQHLLPEYAEVFNFWRPRLRPLQEVLPTIAPGEMLLWQGRHYVKLSGKSMRQMSEPFIAAVIDSGKKLIVVDYSGVTLFSLPGFEELLRAKSESRLHPDAIYELQGTGQYLAVGHHIVVTNDEDNPTEEPTRFTIISTRFPARSSGSLVPKTVPATKEPDPSSPRLVIGKQRTAAVAFATERAFTLGRYSIEEDGERVVIEGSEQIYRGDPPTYSRIRIELATAQKSQENIEPEAGGTAPVSIPASRVHLFPSRIAESAFWTAPQNMTDEFQNLISKPQALDHAFDAAIKAADFSRLDDPNAWRARMNDRIACGIYLDGTTKYLWSECISGNSYATIAVAKVPDAKPVERCDKVEFQVIRARSAVSPSYRWFALASGEGGEQPLFFIDATKVEKITPSQAPAKLLAGMAFNSSSTRFAALTEVDEVMIYDMAAATAPFLLRRIVLGTSAALASTAESEQEKGVPRRPLVFAGNHTLIGLARDDRLFAVDSEKGEILWTRSIASLSGADSLRLSAAPSAPYIAAARGQAVQLFHATTGAALTDSANLGDIWRGIPGAEAAASIDLDRILVASDGAFAIPVGKQFLLRKPLLPTDGMRGTPNRLETLTGINTDDGRTPLAELPVD